MQCRLRLSIDASSRISCLPEKIKSKRFNKTGTAVEVLKEFDFETY